MKRLVQVLTALSLTTTTAFMAAIARAQENVLPELVPLEPADSTSALVLDGVESRNTSLDFQLLFLPDGAGGERNAAEFEYYEPATLIPMATELDLSGEDRIPTYARVEPNRAIRTQTDPQRLMIATPLARQSSPTR